MQIEKYYFSKRQTITLIILLAGLFVGLTLVQKEQITASKASVVSNSFEIMQNSNPPEPVVCQGEVCLTKTLNLLIKSKEFENRPTAPIEAKVISPPANLNIDISSLPDNYKKWANEVLSNTPAGFRSLISSKPTIVKTTTDYSRTEGNIVYIKTNYDSTFFKQIFTHELGHRIKGTAGTRSPGCGGQSIEQAESEGYVTFYAQNATPATVKSPKCWPPGVNDQNTRSDEDFAESVSYYVNRNIGEINYGSGCSTNAQGVNPFDRGYPLHLAYMQCLLDP